MDQPRKQFLHLFFESKYGCLRIQAEFSVCAAPKQAQADQLCLGFLYAGSPAAFPQRTKQFRVFLPHDQSDSFCIRASRGGNVISGFRQQCLGQKKGGGSFGTGNAVRRTDFIAQRKEPFLQLHQIRFLCACRCPKSQAEDHQQAQQPFWMIFHGKTFSHGHVPVANASTSMCRYRLTGSDTRCAACFLWVGLFGTSGWIIGEEKRSRTSRCQRNAVARL